MIGKACLISGEVWIKEKEKNKSEAKDHSLRSALPLLIFLRSAFACVLCSWFGSVLSSFISLRAFPRGARAVPIARFP